MSRIEQLALKAAHSSTVGLINQPATAAFVAAEFAGLKPNGTGKERCAEQPRAGELGRSSGLRSWRGTMATVGTAKLQDAGRVTVVPGR
jgi:hypothetical protein